jgi:hypothetical protein
MIPAAGGMMSALCQVRCRHGANSTSADVSQQCGKTHLHVQLLPVLLSSADDNHEAATGPISMQNHVSVVESARSDARWVPFTCTKRSSITI